MISMKVFLIVVTSMMTPEFGSIELTFKFPVEGEANPVQACNEASELLSSSESRRKFENSFGVTVIETSCITETTTAI